MQFGNLWYNKIMITLYSERFEINFTVTLLILIRERMMYHMSKQFAMLTATRRLENHLSRENYNLDRMASNDNIPDSLFNKKVDHHNELVDALNDLFSNLTDSPSSKLFTRYEQAVSDNFDYIPESTYSEPLPFVRPSAPAESDETEESNDIALWKAEGYESHDAWLADKEAEYAQSPDDLSMSVNDVLSRHRADQALTEYSQTSERDIASYLPEDDSPVSVLPSDTVSQAYDDEGVDPSDVTDYMYLDHTVDNVRVDNDPTQIAGVETAVERYGETARQGTDIDLSSFLYQSDRSVVDDLIKEDIEQLHTPNPLITVGEA